MTDHQPVLDMGPVNGPSAVPGSDALSQDPTTDPRVRPQAYRVYPTDFERYTFSDAIDFTIEVVDGGSEFGWGVYCRSQSFCLSSSGEWELHQRGLRTDPEWLSTHRFDRETALRLALDLVDGLRLFGGQTIADAQARCDRQQAAEG